MELLQLAMLILAGVLVSSLLEPLLPRVSLPLVQVGIGILVAMFVHLPAEVSIESDLFLVLFIAPLLFDESRNADNRALWQNKNSILSLAIGLVIVAVFVIGFVLNLLVPSIPLAAAFALGAALGPTDAVAVASLGKDVNLTKRQKAQLSGEALLNDASGVVSFQFAVAAVATGAFSLAEASKTLAVDFFGGVLVGLLLGFAYIVFTRRIRSAGLDSVTIHVLFELCMPFFTYFTAELFHVSGILAVVAAGILVTLSPLRSPLPAKPAVMSPQATRLMLVSDSVWEVFTFALNGTVFIILGVMLPDLTGPVLEGIDFTSSRFAWLMAVVLCVLVAMYALRFVWLLVMDVISDNAETGGRFHFGSQTLHQALVTTLAGAKGAVAVVIIFTLPTVISTTGEAFPQRSLLIFIVCAVSVLSLLVANFVVPALAPRDEDVADEDTTEAEIRILENVIDELRDRKTKENAQAVAAVVRTYQRRIAMLRKEAVSPRYLRQLRLDVLERQSIYIEDAMNEDSIDRRVAQQYLKRVERLERQVIRAGKHKLESPSKLKPLASSTTSFERVAQGIAPERRVRNKLEFKIDVEEVAVHYLEGAARSKDKERAEAAKALLAEHRPLLSSLKQRMKSMDIADGIITPDTPSQSTQTLKRTETGKLKKVRSNKKPQTLIADMHAEALRIELEEINRMRKKGRISNAAAKDLRQDVYLVQMGLSE